MWCELAEGGEERHGWRKDGKVRVRGMLKKAVGTFSFCSLFFKPHVPWSLLMLHTQPPHPYTDSNHFKVPLYYQTPSHTTANLHTYKYECVCVPWEQVFSPKISNVVSKNGKRILIELLNFVFKKVKCSESATQYY